jgi:formylglycine-generating enzyme required for sulfatase activity
MAGEQRARRARRFSVMQRTRVLWVAALAAQTWAWGGCDDPCPPCDRTDADGDADADTDGEPLPCVIPEVECEDGEHGEYGVCVPDTEQVAVPGGTFDMGAPSGDELPLHTVTVGDINIDQYEVTNERYAACVDAGCCTAPAYDGSYSGRQPYYGNEMFRRCPVIFVTWDQARRYCEGLGARLPTEAEWEHAARGGEGRPYPWGADPPNSSRANFGSSRTGDTGEVGRRPDGATPEGVHDMAGNVWEWVADWYSATYYTESPSDNPQGPESGVARVARGGSFGSEATEIYSFYRVGFHPTETFSNVGFRCVR